MKYDVVYHSTTGNTKKIAEAIAQTAGCDARRTDDDPAPVDADIVFVGGAVYATSNHDVHLSIKRFADRLKAAGYRGGSRSSPRALRKAMRPASCGGFSRNAAFPWNRRAFSAKENSCCSCGDIRTRRTSHTQRNSRMNLLQHKPSDKKTSVPLV